MDKQRVIVFSLNPVNIQGEPLYPYSIYEEGNEDVLAEGHADLEGLRKLEMEWKAVLYIL